VPAVVPAYQQRQVSRLSLSVLLLPLTMTLALMRGSFIP
jgi:hypothetical protein